MSSSNLPPAFRRAKQALRFARVDEGRDYQAAEMSWEAMDAEEPQEKIRLAQRALEYYPLNVESWSVVGHAYLKKEIQNYSASIEAFQTGIEAARIVDPTLTPDRSEPIEWAYMENRPYLRANQGLAMAYADSGKLGAAIETAESLAKWGRTVLNGNLAGWYVMAGRWDGAHRFLRDEIRRAKEKRFSLDVGIAYSWVLVQYHAVEEGTVDSDDELYQALEQALKTNIHVPTLLMTNDVLSRERPESYSHGGESEALLYVLESLKVWETNTGALEWLLSAKERYGQKPNEATLVEMLRKQSVFVEFTNRSAELVTQNFQEMIGTALPEFRMRPECARPHVIGSLIHAQKLDYSCGVRDAWIEFRYDEVEAVPFWSILLLSTNDDEEESMKETPSNEPKQENLSKNQKKNRKNRNRKKRNRQKKALIHGIMSDLTIQNISDIASFLNLKEKAVIRSLNKTWLKGSTLGTKVVVDPKIVGTNLDGALEFVASSFPNLKEFKLSVDQEYFLNNNGDYSHSSYGGDLPDPYLSFSFGNFVPQLSGDSLKSIFDQESICLDSVTIYFDQCITEHISRILVDEEGFSTLHRQVSLQKLELTEPYFASFHSLFSMLRPLVNLQCLKLSSLNFPESEYEYGNPHSLWRHRSNLMKAIGSIPNLRSFVMYGHCITDKDFRHLSRLRDLRNLMIEGHFGQGERSQISLTDASMAVIASSFPKLKSLSVCYNRAITVAGLRKVIRSCPLFQLEASEAGLGEEHLESMVRSRPSLRFVRYGRGYMPVNGDLLKKATIASRGLCGFAGNLGVYEPKFDSTLLANHNATRKFIEDMDSTMSFLYDD